MGIVNNLLEEIEECERRGMGFDNAAESAHRKNMTSHARELYLRASRYWAERNEFETAVYYLQMSEVTEMSLGDADSWVREHKPKGDMRKAYAYLVKAHPRVGVGNN